MVESLFLGVGVGLPCTVMECGDIIYRSTLPRSNGLNITPPGVILALGALSYLWATVGVAPGFWDMFVLAFLERLFRPTFRKDDFVLGKKLGEGAFGVVYKADLANKSSANQGDLVLKKATEYGAMEIWMNEQVRRACANSCAYFVYGFLESSSKGKGGEYWLIWRFEGEATLSDLMLSKEFPYNATELVESSLACLTESKLKSGCQNLATNFEQCPLLNISCCPPSELDLSHGKTLVIVVYNSLGWKREDIVRIPVTVINESVIVLDSEGKEIESQLLPISNASVGLRNYYVRAYTGITPSDTPKFWLAFSATAPPLGFSTYIVSSAKCTGSSPSMSTVHTSPRDENGTIEVGQGNLRLVYAVKEGKLTHYFNSRSMTHNTNSMLGKVIGVSHLLCLSVNSMTQCI